MDDMISVILPCYNISDYLSRCVNSLKSQSYKNFEAIFVNDGSNDDTEKKFNSMNLDKRFIMYNKKNEGSGIARNFGLNQAKGKYVYFMDPDDEIKTTLFEDVINYLTVQEVECLIFGYKQVNEESQKEVSSSYISGKKLLVGKNEIQNKFEEYYNLSNLFPVWNKVFKRKFLTENKIYFTDLPIGQDAVFNLELLEYLTSVLFVPGVYYKYYSDRTGSARTKYNSNRYGYEKIISQKLQNYLLKLKESTKMNELVNEYKVQVVFNELDNLSKNEKPTFKKFKSDPFFKDVQQIKFSSLKNRRQKIKLMIIKLENDFLMQNILKFNRKQKLAES